MAYRPTDLLEVRAWGRTVGAVTLDPASNAYAFEFDAAWVSSGIEVSPFRMPLGPGVFEFPELPAMTYQRLPAMLADSLPDRFGNALVTAALAERGVADGDITALDRLAYMADRAMGALEFRPPVDRGVEAPRAIQLADLVLAARSALRGNFGGDEATHTALAQLIEVGTSAGGARPKAVICFNPHTNQIRSGQLEAPEGFEYWLLKLDGVDDPDEFISSQGYGRVEYAYSLMAASAGIEMTECRLQLEGDRAHFMTKRYDRGGDGPGGKVHVQTLCALDHLDFNLQDTHSYAQLMIAIDRLDLGVDARDQAFRRCAFNVAAANRDDHTKNLSFLCAHTGDWSLSPAYDVNHSHNPNGRWTQRHQMSVNGKFEDITRADLLELADRFAVPAPRAALADVVAAVARWPEFAGIAGVDEVHASRVAADLHRSRLDRS